MISYSTKVAAACLIATILLALSNRYWLNARRFGPLQDPLEARLLHWSPNDPFTVRKLLNGGVAIFGVAGSGKTNFSGMELGTGIVRHKRSGGLILAAKPEDLTMWQLIFAEAGRSSDLRIFSPDQPLRFNFLDYEVRQGGHTRNIAQCIRIISESLQTGDARGGGEDGKFWEQQQDRMFYHAIEVVKRATGKVTAPDLQQFILTAAMSAEQLLNDKWQKQFHYQCIEAANKAPMTAVEAHDFKMATDYWLAEFVLMMPDKTRGSVLAGVMGILHVFNSGIVRELVSGETNISPDDMFNGTWVLVNMSPAAEGGELGRFVCSGWKFLTQRRVLRRQANQSDSINVIWADEAQQFVNSYDAHYLAQCRSHLGCMVFLSQSLPGYFASLKGESGQHETKALLSNFTHAIVHAVDPTTAEWAASRLGKRREALFGGSIAPSSDIFDDLFGNHQITGSFSDHYENVVQETLFMNGLRMGTKTANGRSVCDAIIIKSGEPFASGENWLRKTFYKERS